MKIEDLIIGQKYTNENIREAFSCSMMSGMNRSHETNSLVLIAKHNNPLYDDQWVNGILNYTGQGTKGDQSIDFNQNKTLANSNVNNVRVFLFESYKNGEYYYDGEVELIKEPYFSEEPDIDGNMRKVIKFPLKRKDELGKIYYDINDIRKTEEAKAKVVKKLNSEEVKTKARESETQVVVSKEVKSVYRERNQYIAEYTKNRAKGVCDLCEQRAPFKDKNGKPYLEEHHLITLAENGPDAIYNTVAICPNCHRKIHILQKKEDIKKLQGVILKYLLSDDDKENLKKFEELFK